jgi:CRISPR-associated protein Cas5t
MSGISLQISVPFCSFRRPYAREFLESERFPPPATVYGFLLSLVGEELRETYVGTKLATAIVRKPQVSQVLRTVWRIKKKNLQPGTGSNKRPDYQEVLSGLKVGVWIAEGPLAEKLLVAAEHPELIDRYGGLCLGESRDLVDEIHFQPEWTGTGIWLTADENGEYPLPIWVDHVGSIGTRWGQFCLREASLSEPPHDDPRWVMIHCSEALS